VAGDARRCLAPAASTAPCRVRHPQRGDPAAALSRAPAGPAAGGVVVLEFSTPRGLFGLLFGAYSRHVLPRVGGWISGDRGAYAYLPASVARFATPDAFGARLEAAGFTSVRWAPLTGGIAHVFEGTRA
jgi:demethylmenaquinone methyltransferase/2-methoxy-6-polyprenyl-1,4-benzoquinol methylase